MSKGFELTYKLATNYSAAPQPLTGKVYTHFNTKVCQFLY